MLKYYIPMVYTFTTRYNNIFAAISFLIFTCLPSLFLVISHNIVTIGLLVNYCIIFYAMYAAYEIGYLFNDIITTQFEKDPTNRIQEMYINRMPKHLENMVTVRLIVISLGAYWTWSIGTNIEIFIIMLFLLLIFYSIHNYFRNGINILTMFLLVFLKNFIPIIPFVKMHNWQEASILIIISICVIRTYEFATKKRFHLKIDIDNIDVFRIKYYIFVLAIMCGLFSLHYVSASYIELPLFFLLYRLFIWKLLKLKNFRKNS